MAATRFGRGEGLDRMAEKFQYFNGVKFTRDEDTGYYLNSTLRIRMHRYVWEFYNGPIPTGHDIHHIDHDKGNNSIDNLEMLTISEHRAMHAYETVHVDEERTREHLNGIRPLASAWHASENGIEWHKAHYSMMADKLHAPKEYSCLQCGKKFVSTQTESKFCSNACKSAWRRATGVDDVERICRVCGRPYSINKYQKTKTCGKECARKLRRLTMCGGGASEKAETMAY